MTSGILAQIVYTFFVFSALDILHILRIFLYLNHPNYIWRTVQGTKPFVVYFSSSFYYFHFSWPIIFSTAPSNTLSFYVYQLYLFSDAINSSNNMASNYVVIFE